MAYDLQTSGNMTTSTYKHIKVTGRASESIEAAVRAALGTTSRTVREHSWFEIVELRGNLAPNGEIQEYQVTLEVGFSVERDAD